MKRILSLCLSLAMLLCLTCTAMAEGETLNVAWWGGQVRTEAFEKALAIYAQENNVTIQTQTNGFNDHITAMSTAGASGDLPHMLMLQASYMGNFIDGDMLVDLTPYVESGVLDLSNVPQSVVDTGKVNGGLYGICAGVNAPALVYNKTLLDASGIAVKDGMTIEEFCALCKEIYEKTGVKTQITNWTTMVEYLARSYDRQMFVDGKLGVESYEELLPYFQIVERGFNEGWLIDYSIVANAVAIEEQALVTGAAPEFSSWCVLYYSNQLQSLQDCAPEGVELAVTTWPTNDLAKSNYLRQAMCWSISSQTEDVEAAVKLLNWWTNSVDAQSCVLGEPGVPANSEVATTISADLPDATQKAFTYVVDVVSPASSVANPPSSNGFTEVDVLISELNEMVCTGNMTAEEAAKTLFEDGSAIMESAN